MYYRLHQIRIQEELFEVKADLPYLCEIEKFCFNCGARMVKEIEK